MKNIERVIATELNCFVAPDDNIKCKDCVYRNTELTNGYKRAMCKKFRHKPKEILFENKDCESYEKDVR